MPARTALGILAAALVFSADLFGAPSIKMATTTSTDNSGLLGVLLPAFEKETGIAVQVLAVGTGKAIKHGENGDVDLILVHARAAEDAFVAKGFGVDRRDVMYNDFVLLGPPSDPAGIRGRKSVVDAMRRLAGTQVSFVSRGDESGTHKKEQELWAAAGSMPERSRYIEAGQGMGQVLMMADEKQAYTLADRGTFIAFGDKIELEVVVEGDSLLFNPYGVIAVNPERNPHVNREDAARFIDWLTGARGQELIGGFTIKGKQLFCPSAGGKR